MTGAPAAFTCQSRYPGYPGRSALFLNPFPPTPTACSTLPRRKLVKSTYYLKQRVGDGTFTVMHYAGAVTYTTKGMIDDNRDTLFSDLGVSEACGA